MEACCEPLESRDPKHRAAEVTAAWDQEQRSICFFWQLTQEISALERNLFSLARSRQLPLFCPRGNGKNSLRAEQSEARVLRLANRGLRGGNWS
jgi:hypothetical protein